MHAATCHVLAPPAQRRWSRQGWSSLLCRPCGSLESLVLTLHREANLMPRTSLLPGHFSQCHGSVHARSKFQLELESLELAPWVIVRSWIETQQAVFVGLDESDIGVSVPDMGPRAVCWTEDDRSIPAWKGVFPERGSVSDLNCYPSRRRGGTWADSPLIPPYPFDIQPVCL